MQEDYYNLKILERFLNQKAAEYGLVGIKHPTEGKVISFYANLETYHLFTKITSDLAVENLDIQYSIQTFKNRRVRVLAFADPILLFGQKMIDDACLLVDELNTRMQCFGKFYVDRLTGDVAFSVSFSYELLQENPDLIEEILFEEAISFWEMLHVPLMMLAQGRWRVDLSIQYLKEILENGYVNNKPYGL